VDRHCRRSPLLYFSLISLPDSRWAVRQPPSQPVISRSSSSQALSHQPNELYRAIPYPYQSRPYRSLETKSPDLWLPSSLPPSNFFFFTTRIIPLPLLLLFPLLPPLFVCFSLSFSHFSAKYPGARRWAKHLRDCHYAAHAPPIDDIVHTIPHDLPTPPRLTSGGHYPNCDHDSPSFCHSILCRPPAEEWV
jgi:hypothetical protein